MSAQSILWMMVYISMILIAVMIGVLVSNHTGMPIAGFAAAVAFIVGMLFLTVRKLRKTMWNREALR